MTYDAMYRSGADLARRLPWIDVRAVDRVARRYPLCVPPYYLSLLDPHDPHDPLARQCAPDPAELRDAGDPEDPFGEEGMAINGLVQRYPDRALVRVTGCCAMRCRHCTRKNLLDAGAPPERDRVLEALRDRPGVREVILSGGDPLCLPPDELEAWLAGLRALPRVKVLRIGTRIPVVEPHRLDERTAERLAACRPLWVNTQFNHPREVTPAALAACERLIRRGIPVSNQAVLLKGVNDAADTLVALCRTLQEHMIRPYYLFHGDPVRGTAHLRTTLDRTTRLAAELARRLSGLALPRVVVDDPATACKRSVEALAAEYGRRGGDSS